MEFSFEDTNINGLFKALDKPKLSKDEFDDIANRYAKQLRKAGYDRTCRIGIYSNWKNIFKIFGAMQVCSPVIVDEKFNKFETEKPYFSS